MIDSEHFAQKIFDKFEVLFWFLLKKNQNKLMLHLINTVQTCDANSLKPMNLYLYLFLLRHRVGTGLEPAFLRAGVHFITQSLVNYIAFTLFIFINPSPFFKTCWVVWASPTPFVQCFGSKTESVFCFNLLKKVE